MMVAFSIQMLLISCAVFISCVSAFEKHWLRTISWDDPSNWDPPRIPCPNDRIVLKSAIVYIEKNITVEYIKFHTNGEIVFGPNTELTFSEKSERKKRAVSRCSGPGVSSSFIGQEKKHWLNPMNWDIYTNGKKDEYLTAAVPYVERVPCIDDTVTFSKTNAFEINVEGKVTIKDIILNEQVITNNVALQSFFATNEGKIRFSFQTGASLELNSRNSCGISGCKCGNDVLIKSICNTFKCPQTCAKKVKPHNDCCYHCGALINIQHDVSFNLNQCWKDLRLHLLRKSNFAGVRLYMSVIGSKNIQILISEDSDGSNAEAAADSIQDNINNSTSKICTGIKSSKKVSYIEEETSATTIALAVVLPIIFVALIIIAAAYFNKKRNTAEIKEQRFENEDNVDQYPGVNDIEMITDFTIPDLYPGTRAFDNPSYDIQYVKDDDGEIKYDIASPEYSIPVKYFPKKSNKETDIPRYVDIDDIKDVGNVNPLYEEVMNEVPEKFTPVDSEVDLDSSDETASMRKLQLKLKDLSDSEGDGIENELDVPVEETVPYYAELEKSNEANH